MNDMPSNYEHFMRSAFLFGTGKPVGRWGDPAQLASPAHFDDLYIAEVKVAVGYAMAIMRNAVEGVSEDETKRLDSFIKDIISASDIRAINRLITNFKDTVVNQYFTSQNGHITLKPKN